MEVRACRECRRLFNYLSGIELCPKCKNKVENKFQDVRHYLRENPNASVAQVSEACSVEVSQITQWVQEEQLEMASSSGLVHCEWCKKIIPSGRFCDKCRMKLALEINELKKGFKKVDEVEKEKHDGPRMRFIRH